MLSLFPFVDQSVVAPTVALLPLASYVLLLFAHRQYDGEEGPSAKREASFIEGGVRRLRTQIPFEEDRKFIVLKGLFALLYSVSLGFAACASLASWLYPGNAVVIGFGNVAAALVMVAVLRRRERDVCNVLPKLFLPVTSFCYLFLGALWPTEGVLVCAAVLFVLFGCYEILNAHTAYAYSSYDAVRCLWELYSLEDGQLGRLLSGVGVRHGEPLLLRGRHHHLAGAVLLHGVFGRRGGHGPVQGDEARVPRGGGRQRAHAGSARRQELRSPAARARGRWSRACEELAEQYKLSPRQKEIFLLLAKGRNVQFIRDELVLSTPTVKSHIYNIYQKMGVHSHQELIDLVENGVKGA